jgi:transposase
VQRGDVSTDAKNNKKAPFVGSFKLLDLNTNMYMAYGLSFKSEETYERAMAVFYASEKVIASL